MKSYIFSPNGGEEPFESVGVLGSAPIAFRHKYQQEPTNPTLWKKRILGQVVGVTELSHPLVPNSEEFSKTVASIVQEENKIVSWNGH